VAKTDEPLSTPIVGRKKMKADRALRNSMNPESASEVRQITSLDRN